MGDRLLTSLKLVQFDHLIENVAEEAYKQIMSITSDLHTQTDEEKKRSLLQHLHATKQRLQRLDILLQWCHKAPAVAECKRVLEVAAMHVAALRDSADQLAYLHDELLRSQLPSYDVSTAYHILRQGGYSLLPNIIQDELRLQQPSNLTVQSKDVMQHDVYSRFNFLIRSKLMEEGLPAGMAFDRIDCGTAVLQSLSRQYAVVLSLVPAPDDDVVVAKWSSPQQADKVQQQESPGIGGNEGKSDGQGQTPTRERSPKTTTTTTTTTTAAAAAAGGGGEGAPNTLFTLSSHQPHHRWRWRVLSFKLFPGIISPSLNGAPVHHHKNLGDTNQQQQQRQQQSWNALPPALYRWLQQNIEDRVWAVSDIQVLQRLGKADLVIVPLKPLTKEERSKRKKDMEEAGRGLSLEDKASMSTGVNPSDPTSMQEEGGDGDVAEQHGLVPGKIPVWASTPLHAVHAVLEHASGKLAVGSLLLEQARKLEIGSWKGLMKVGRSPSFKLTLPGSKEERISSGLRISIWLQVPLLHSHNLPHQQEAPQSSVLGCVLDVIASPSSGLLSCLTTVPGPQQSTTNTAVAMAVKQEESSTASIHAMHAAMIDVLSPESGRLSAENLIIRAATRCATVQLQSMQSMLEEKASSPRSVFYNASSPTEKSLLEIELVTLTRHHATPSHDDDPSPAVPALQLSIHKKVYLIVHINIKTGLPVIAIGHSLAEDAATARTARHIAEHAHHALKHRLSNALSDALPPGIPSKALHWMNIIVGGIHATLHALHAEKLRSLLCQEAVISTTGESGDRGHGCFTRAFLPGWLSDAVTVHVHASLSPINDRDATTIHNAPPSGLTSSSLQYLALKVPIQHGIVSSPLLLLSSHIPIGQRGGLLCYFVADVIAFYNSIYDVTDNADGANSRSISRAGWGHSGLALCWCTPCGIPKALYKFIPTPPLPEIIVKSESGQQQQQHYKGEDGAGGGGKSSAVVQHGGNKGRSRGGSTKGKPATDAGQEGDVRPEGRRSHPGKRKRSTEDVDIALDATAMADGNPNSVIGTSLVHTTGTVRLPRHGPWKELLAWCDSVTSSEQLSFISQAMNVKRGTSLPYALPGLRNSKLVTPPHLKRAVILIAPARSTGITKNTNTTRHRNDGVQVTIDWAMYEKKLLGDRHAYLISPFGVSTPAPGADTEVDADQNNRKKDTENTLAENILPTQYFVLDPPVPEWAYTTYLAVLHKDDIRCELLGMLDSTALGLAALQRSAFSEEAQKKAGLMPEALTIERCVWGFRGGSTIKESAKKSGIVVSNTLNSNGEYAAEIEAVIAQLGRAVKLTFAFTMQGKLTVRCRNLPVEGDGAWLQRAWESMKETVLVDGDDGVILNDERDDSGVVYCARLNRVDMHLVECIASTILKGVANSA